MVYRRESCALALRITLVGCGLLSITACSLPIPTAQHGPTPTAAPHHSGRLTFVTTQDSLYALDTGDGAVRWRAPVGMVSSRPTVADSSSNVILLQSNISSFLAIRAADGSILWQRGALYRYETAKNGVAVFSVFQQTGITLSAVRVTTGQEMWHVDSDLIIADVEIDGDTVLVAMEDPAAKTCPGGIPTFRRLRILALNILDGSVRWATDTPQQRLWGGMAAENGTVYLSTRDEGEGCVAQPYQLYAADVATGKLLWKVATDQNFRIEQVVNGIVYAPSAAGVDAYRGKDGALLWRSGGRDDSFVYASATRVLLAKGEDQLVALDSPSGILLWSLPGKYVYGEDILDGTLYRTEADTNSTQLAIVAYEMTAGSVHWKATLPRDFYPSLAMADGKLIVLQALFYPCRGLISDVTVTALGATTGDTVWERVLPKTITSGTPTPTIHARSLC